MTFLLLALDSPKLWTLKAQIFREDAALNTHKPTANSRTEALISWRSIALLSKTEPNPPSHIMKRVSNKRLPCSLTFSASSNRRLTSVQQRPTSLQWAVESLGNMQVNVCEKDLCGGCAASGPVENGASSGTAKTSQSHEQWCFVSGIECNQTIDDATWPRLSVSWTFV